MEITAEGGNIGGGHNVKEVQRRGVVKIRRVVCVKERVRDVYEI